MNTSTPESTKSEIIDLERIRLPQDYMAAVKVTKALSNIPVRKPHRQWWTRTHPDDLFHINTTIFEDQETRDNYIVAPELTHEMAGEGVPKTLYLCISRQNVLFYNPVRLPGEDAKLDSWNESAHEIAEAGKKGWVRRAANMQLGAYDWFTTEDITDEPKWPKITPDEAIRLAFKNKLINSVEHPVIRRLHGRI